MGEDNEYMKDLLPWLINTMKSDSSTVERAGGAQGLCEVLVALGDQRLASVLTDVMALKSHPDPCAREGLVWHLSFMAPVFGVGFESFVSKSMDVILLGLSDEVEQVRTVALRT